MSVNLEQLLALIPETQTRACKFAPWFLSLSEDDQNAIIKAMDNPDIETRHIYKTLKAVGCPSAESSIRTHRARQCQNCERTIYV
jgi:hypothetical protein